MYKDYENILELYEGKVHNIIEKKLNEYLNNKKKWQMA